MLSSFFPSSSFITRLRGRWQWFTQINANLTKQQRAQRAHIPQVNPITRTGTFLRILPLIQIHIIVSLRSGNGRGQPDLLVRGLLVDDIRPNRWEGKVQNTCLCHNQFQLKTTNEACEDMAHTLYSTSTSSLSSCICSICSTIASIYASASS